jgi:putative two-component system response regulator
MTPPDPHATSTQSTVLVVDDTPANLTLLAQVLKPYYRVQLAVSGAKALEICRRQPPDLIVLDVMMPALDGHEVCRQLKADPATRRVPVIFLTALTRTEDESAGFEVGGADFIHKPFNPATVLARVRTHLQLKLAEDRLLRHNTQLSGELDASWSAWRNSAMPTPATTSSAPRSTCARWRAGSPASPTARPT